MLDHHVGIGGIATMMGGKDDFAEGKAAGTRMIKDRHLTQSDLKWLKVTQKDAKRTKVTQRDSKSLKVTKETHNN